MKSSSGSKERARGLAPRTFDLKKLVGGPAPVPLSLRKQVRGPVPLTASSEKRAGGFTLIEIMITIAIIGLMTAIVMSYLGAAKARGRDAKRIADIKQIEQGIEVYFSSCNTYPENLGGLILDCNGNPILSSIPLDPSNTPYRYAVGTDPTLQYHLCAILELGYAGGIGKAGHEQIKNLKPEDECNGNDSSVFDKYGP